MDWVDEFYSVTGDWWGEAEAAIGADDRRRADYVDALDPERGSVLELGCGYGSTATLMAERGRSVTGIDLSSRIEQAPEVGPTPGAPTLIRGDFYAVDLDGSFDVVCYWDGFGVGTDDDQRRLLRRIAADWLHQSGVAVVEVFNPIVWADSAGLMEFKEPDPERGYPHRLGHRRKFDSQQRRALDIWWVDGDDRELTQSLRCYSPAELGDLVEGTGLRIDDVTRLDDPAPSVPLELDTHDWSYVVQLRQA